MKEASAATKCNGLRKPLLNVIITHNSCKLIKENFIKISRKLRQYTLLFPKGKDPPYIDVFPI